MQTLPVTLAHQLKANTHVYNDFPCAKKLFTRSLSKTSVEKSFLSVCFTKFNRINVNKLLY